MERQLLCAIVSVLNRLVERRSRGRFTYSDVDILRVYYWSVINDRSRHWACQRQNWPLWDRRHPLPSESELSRRMRSRSIRQLMDGVESHVTRPSGDCMWWIIDGKPMTIGGASKDRQAGFGRAAGCKAKGYKIHAIVSGSGEVAAWRVAPMNVDERVMACRLVRHTKLQGYLVADSNYDSNPLHDVCLERDNLQLVTPSRYKTSKGIGHHRHSPSRLRSLQMTGGSSTFGERLMHDRDSIERYYGNVTSFGGGLTHLPPWVRTHRRVRQWVQTKLIIHALRKRLQTTYVA